MIDFSDGRYRVQGPVTFATVEQVLEEARGRFDGASLQVDLSGITEADSAAVGLLLLWVREALERAHSIRFENPTQSLKTLIALYEVENLLPGIRG
jgi:phospholipid transport system transporter-binding protein